MSLLFETMRISDGKARHLTWHEWRMNRARQEIWDIRKPILLSEQVQVPNDHRTDLICCNVHYGPEIESITFKSYEKKHIRFLRLIDCDRIDYHVKYSDRSLLETLWARRGDCDDIIIVRYGLLTDTSMSNLIFYDGKHWITPAKPLLEGTCRERLLSEGRIKKASIRPEDLYHFKGIKLINAMRDPDEEDIIPVENLKRL